MEAKGRTVLVTGGGKGIGRAIAERFARSGHQVIITGRDESALSETAARHGGITAQRCDVTDEAEVTALFDTCDPIDVLVNNAGIALAAPAHKHGLEDWNRLLAVNATGVFLCTRAALPAMRATNWGRIITVASTAGVVGYRYTAGYTASKHAAIGLMRAVASETCGTGITVNSVCPSYVRTEMTERTIENIIAKTGRSRDDALSELTAASPLGRLIEPDEVAAAVAFLASQDAAPIHGQTLILDGGGVQS